VLLCPTKGIDIIPGESSSESELLQRRGNDNAGIKSFLADLFTGPPPSFEQLPAPAPSLSPACISLTLSPAASPLDQASLPHQLLPSPPPAPLPVPASEAAGVNSAYVILPAEQLCHALAATLSTEGSSYSPALTVTAAASPRACPVTDCWMLLPPPPSAPQSRNAPAPPPPATPAVAHLTCKNRMSSPTPSYACCHFRPRFTSTWATRRHQKRRRRCPPSPQPTPNRPRRRRPTIFSVSTATATTSSLPTAAPTPAPFTCFSTSRTSSL